MTEPRNHLEYLRALKSEVEGLHGRVVTVERATTDTPRGDTAESLAASLRRRKIVRER